MSAHKSFLEYSGVPSPLGHGFTSKDGLPLLDKLIGSHLNVIVEKVATEGLLSILVVDHIGRHEEHSIIKGVWVTNGVGGATDL